MVRLVKVRRWDVSRKTVIEAKKMRLDEMAQ